VRATLIEMAGIDVTPGSISDAGTVPLACDIAVVVELGSTQPGTLTLGFPQRTAEGLAARILAEVKVPTDDLVISDCVREIANVVAGQAKTALAATPQRFSCSLPGIGDAGTLRTPLHVGEGFFVVFDSPAGEFGLLLRWRGESN
jgi:CheY-specific phosphatase CheX